MLTSIWQNKTPSRFPKLAGDRRTDVLIIGGGLTGVLCARLLTDAGIDCIVAEAQTIGSGTSGNTTAKITAQHGLFAAALMHQLGRDRTYRIVQARLEAARALFQLCSTLDCNLQRVDSCVYTRFDRDALERELTALQDLGVPVRFRQQLPLPFRTCGGVVMPHQGVFHPCKFLGSIATGLDIAENTPVQTIRGHKAITEHGTITAQHIIIATHFPFWNRHGGYFARLYQERSYVLALQNAPETGGIYLDADPQGFHFRDYGNLVLLSGGGHRTGTAGKAWRPLREFAKRYWPQAVETAAWAAQDCITLDGLPYVGAYSARVPHILVATGYAKWGMTGSMTAAQMLTDHILGREHPCTELFTPQRSLPLSKLAANSMEAALDMAIPLPRRCPHLGCALRWNPAEHTWDCPCHGSRFTKSGQLLDGPSQHSLP